MPSENLYIPLLYANPEAVLYPELDPAYRGYVCVLGGEAVACYSYEAAVEVLVERDGMEPDDAADYVDYNYVGCYGPHHPLWLYECKGSVAGNEVTGTDAADGRTGRVRAFSRHVWACVRGSRRRSSVKTALAGER